ncbi:MAG: SH3 domain-containing protein [Herpetosiphonaceae bacterium]|nr:SH3 domain-containing protein [Herpetosiphonaceae bacterium]
MSTNASDAPGNEQVSRRSARSEPTPPRISDDRIRELITALGDSNHPLHASAINELVAIGQPAVGPLTAALAPDRPWLTSYRAAEALAQIGDGAASGALMGALRHPNSNVRWSAVRALAEVGDTRTLWALRRVAHEDRGKTSWGESVADTAQSALDRLQSRSALLRFSEPVKTAVVLVLALLGLLLATNRVQAVLGELRRDVPAPVVAAGSNATATNAAADETPTSVADTVAITPTVTTTATTTNQLIGKVTQGGRVRSGPGVSFPQIGNVAVGDQLVFSSSDPGGNWYRVRLGSEHDPNSIINGTGEGWVSALLIGTGKPAEPVPTEKPIRR